MYLVRKVFSWPVLAALVFVAGIAFIGGSTPSTPKAKATTKASIDWELPFSSGQTWWYTGAPHPTGFVALPDGTQLSGPEVWSGLDFAPPDGNQNPYFVSSYWALAMAPGVVRYASNSCNLVVIDHGGGWWSLYYHLAGIDVSQGQQVAQGQPIGHPSMKVGCGGYASGTHVHVALLYNQAFIPADGQTFSGWTIHAGSAPYDGTASNGRSWLTAMALMPNAPYGTLNGISSGATIHGTQAVINGYAIGDSSGVNAVQIWIDGNHYADASYGASNSQAGCNCGYSYTLDTTKLSNGPHNVAVWVVANDGVSNFLYNGESPEAVTVSNPLGKVDAFSSPTLSGSKVSITGWANDGSIGIKSVTLLVDGNQAAQATYPVQRSDGNPGFQFNWDSTQVSSGPHIISVQVTSNDGAVVTLPFASGGNTVNVNVQNSILDVSPQQLSFSGVDGVLNPPIQQVNIKNDGTGNLPWTAQSDSSWLILGTGSGSGPAALNVDAYPGQMTPGNYTGHITITGDQYTAHSPQVVTVNFTVQSGTALTVQSPELWIAANQNSGASARGDTISNIATDSLTWKATINLSSSLKVPTPAEQHWLTLSQSQGTLSYGQSYNLQVQTNPDGLRPNTFYFGTVTVSAFANKNGQQVSAGTWNIQVRYYVAPPGTQQQNVANGSSLPTSSAPGFGAVAAPPAFGTAKQ